MKYEDGFVHKYDEVIKCSKCGSIMTKLVTGSSKYLAAKVFPADGVFLDNVSPDGKLFRSEKEMRDFERTSGMEIDLLH